MSGPTPFASSAARSCASWEERNQAYLVGEFAALRKRFADASPDYADAAASLSIEPSAPLDPPAAIDTLAQRCALSPFERALLLLCAGVEMDSTLAALCERASGQPERRAVTFALALAVLDEPHWSALAPSRPLRRLRLIEMEPGYGVTRAPLRIDERVLHYLAGVNQIDERLRAVLHRKTAPAWVAGEHAQIVRETACPLPGDEAARALHLWGDDPAGQEDVAAVLAHEAGVALYVLRHEDTPPPGDETEQFVRLWTRESLLQPAVLLLQWSDEPPGPAARQLSAGLPPALVIASREPLRLARAFEHVEVNKPGPTSQRQIWEAALGPRATQVDGILDDVAQQFRLSAEGIVAIGAATIGAFDAAPAAHGDEGENAEPGDPAQLRAKIWDACRALARPSLEGLAERIQPRAGWDDLVLPDLQREMLHELAMQSRHRMTVYETWGFAAKGRRGLGLSALFSGPSGTGKTLAAEVLANELALDLYRIDLSSVVSKYIGETEKNLKRAFDAAESGGVVLLFDEADALFGKRSEVRDSHDRYANIEVGYLLQRMESFQGLAILTTNLKTSIDKAFQRRLRFMIDFPYPDAAQREAIWSRIFPAGTPTRGLQPGRLANLNMAGGNIRNIALNAAFLAASSGEPVGMAHVLRATRMEAAKIDRPLAAVETRGWV
ncbi:ATP-binding protein [Paraburkholderia acidiphila]|uniref:AAA family ATPase n=1 Tax=Paraburkholderia acidiphila TaxID=2571747 RepID=A0A7Z2JDW0_9BURK|nr:AAA family ATPase [Paraburkholderia acidiphila]QGZ59465.1 AAA family ATPase [Paraburkholderia acidiphila]